MKKVLSFFAILLVAFTLTSCFNGTDADKFEIISYPKATYVKGENFDWSTLKVNVNGTIYGYEEAKGITGIEFPEIELFDSEKGYQKGEGTYSATIRYNSLTASFQYTILDSYFANGNGTKENPYQISTQAQLVSALVDHDKVKYYVLINNITLDSSFKCAQNVKNIHLDGQNYKINNLVDTFMKNVDGDVVIENINFDVRTETSFVLAFLNGYRMKSNIVYRNINTYGKSSNWSNNSSIYGYVWNGSVTLDNCNNYMYIDAHSAKYCGLFTTTVTCNAQLSVLNCKNYGTIIAQSVGLFYGCGTNYNTERSATIIIDENTKNYGEVISSIYESTLLEAGAVKNNAGKVCIYKYDSKKGLNYNLYGEDDKFILNKSNGYLVDNYNKSENYKKLGVDSLCVDSDFLTFVIDNDGFDFILKNDDDIQKISKIEIQFMGSYVYAYANGTVDCVDKNGVSSPGGSNRIFYLASVESDATQSAYAKFIELLATLNNYKIRNIDSFNTEYKDSYKLEEGFLPTTSTLTDAAGRVLRIYEKHTDSGVEKVFVVDTVEHEGQNGKYYEFAGSFYDVSITLFDDANNVIGSTLLKIDNK